MNFAMPWKHFSKNFGKIFSFFNNIAHGIEKKMESNHKQEGGETIAYYAVCDEKNLSLAIKKACWESRIARQRNVLPPITN